MARLGNLSDESVPLLVDLERAAPDLDELFTRLGPFAEASRPALDALGEARPSRHARVARSDEELAELRRLSADAPAFAKPLRQFLETMDDRKRGARARRAREGRRAARAGPDRDPGHRPASPASSRSGTTRSGRRSP